MAFEIYVPRSYNTVDPGHCSIDTSGRYGPAGPLADVGDERGSDRGGVLNRSK